MTIHWGKLGEEGETRELPHAAGLHPSGMVKREAKRLGAAGFNARKTNDLHSVDIQYKIEVHGAVNEHGRRVQIEELMNEYLGWSRRGHCDVGDIGSGQINVSCYVVDTAIAERVIVSELKKHGLLNGTVIAERSKGDAKVLWPHDFSGTFAVL